jgi:hypothetical protein
MRASQRGRVRIDRFNPFASNQGTAALGPLLRRRRPAPHESSWVYGSFWNRPLKDPRVALTTQPPSMERVRHRLHRPHASPQSSAQPGGQGPLEAAIGALMRTRRSLAAEGRLARSLMRPDFNQPRMLADRFRRNGVILGQRFGVRIATPMLSVEEGPGGFCAASLKSMFPRAKGSPFFGRPPPGCCNDVSGTSSRAPASYSVRALAFGMATPTLSVEEGQRALLASLKSLQRTRRGWSRGKGDPFSEPLTRAAQSELGEVADAARFQ